MTFSSPYSSRSHFRHGCHCHYPPPSLPLKAFHTTDQTVTKKKTEGRGPRSHHPLTRGIDIRDVLKGQYVFVRKDVLANASNTIQRIPKHQIDGKQGRLLMRRLVLEHKHSEINLSERAYTVHSFPHLFHHINGLWIELKRYRGSFLSETSWARSPFFTHISLVNGAVAAISFSIVR